MRADLKRFARPNPGRAGWLNQPHASNPGGLGQAALPKTKPYGASSRTRTVPNQLFEAALVITMPGTPQPRFDRTSVPA